MRNFFKKTLTAILLAQARATIRLYKPHVVAITGSVGKTSTKDAVYEVMAAHTHVRKTQKSFNSEIGLPLTILGIPNAWGNPLRWIQNIVDGVLLLIVTHRYPRWLVLEVGADRPGDIKSVAQWLPVDVAVITRLPEIPVHVEFFDSAEAVVEEKAALISALKPEGILVIYADDTRTNEFRARAGAHRVITFGMSAGADVRAESFELLYEEGAGKWPIGMRATISLQGTSVPFSVVGTLGVHTLLPALAAAAVGVALGYDALSITEALKKYAPPAGRMHLIAGIKDTLIIDDTYNSSPAALEAALNALKSVASRKIAVLGDMLELGRYSVEEHRKIGALAAANADVLVTVGFRARDIAQGALDAGMPESAILQFERAEAAREEVAALLAAGDCVLVKGSQSTRMEKVVKAIMAEPDRAVELLVRQDAEWKKR